MINSKTRKMLSYTILLYSLICKKECELCKKLHMISKHPLTHQYTIRDREMIKCHCLPTRLRKKITSLHIKQYAPPN